jgi:hypothetical protein
MLSLDLHGVCKICHQMVPSGCLGRSSGVWPATRRRLPPELMSRSSLAVAP